ncbi:MAG: BON domain-containing protein [Acidobacteria bacterium]|nr:BON domain-containing protein [Acidobacteriota bacterium]
MPLTRKGTFYVFLILLLLLGGAGYYLYNETGSFDISRIWKRWTGEAEEASRGPMGDAEVRAAILETILKSPELRSQGIEVVVTEKTVTIMGNVETPMQRATLEQLASGLAGTRQLNMTVGVRAATVAIPSAASSDTDARLPREVEFALYKTDAFDVKTLKVSSQDRTIHLAGTVRNLAEKLLAERIARDVPDVRAVQNDLEVLK